MELRGFEPPGLLGAIHALPQSVVRPHLQESHVGFAPPLRPPCLRTADLSGRGRITATATSPTPSSHEPPNHAPFGLAERRRESNLPTEGLPRPAGFRDRRVGGVPRGGLVVSQIGLFAGLSRTERRRSRTYQPLGYNGLPVLKTARVWLWERECGW